MASPPTIRDVARDAGVSVGTVSRVINGQPYVTAEIQQRVQEAMRRLNYRPNAVAQSMRTRATRAVGFIIVDIANPVFGAFAKAAQEVLHAADYTLVLANTGERPAFESELVSIFQRRQIDGLIMTVSNEDNPKLLEVLGQLQIPIVLLDREIAMPFDAVIGDHARGMSQATEYLLKLGHRRIGLITASQGIRPGRERVRGYVDAHRSLDIDLDPTLVRSGSLATEYGRREAYALLTMPAPPTALISGGNQILAGVLKAASSLGGQQFRSNYH